jgi:hypothetical protein
MAYKNKKDQQEYSKKYYENHKEEYKNNGKKYQKNNRSAINERYRAYRARDKKIVFEHYGNKCVCCGEDNIKFLTIDHIDGGGHIHRQKVGSRVYSSIITDGFPLNYQILCYNCNCAKGIYGICPHQE